MLMSLTGSPGPAPPVSSMDCQLSKSGSPRVRPKRHGCPGSDVHEKRPSPGAKRSTRSASSHQRETYRKARSPRRKAPKSMEQSMQEQHLVAEKSCIPSPQPPSEDSTMLHCEWRMQQNGGGPPSGKSHRSSKGTDGLSICSGSSPSSQRPSEDNTMLQCRQRLQQNRGGCPSGKRHKSLKATDDLSIRARSTRRSSPSSQRPSEHNAMLQSEQRMQKNDDGPSRKSRTSLNGTGELSIGIRSRRSSQRTLFLNPDQGARQGVLKCGSCKCSDQSEAIALLRKEKSILQKGMNQLRKTIMKLLAGNRGLEEKLVAIKNQSSKRSFNKRPKRRQDETLSREPARIEIAGFNGRSDDMQELTNLRNYISNGHEQLVELKIGEANEDNKPLAPLSGAYTDAFATPNLLDKALSVTKNAVTSFQKHFFKSVISKLENPLDLLDPDHVVFFARPNNLGFLVRSFIYEVFFRGFETESFDTLLGVSRFLDPDLRQEEYFEHYCREEKCADSDIDDAQFEEFCKEKAYSLVKKFPYYDEKCIEQLGRSLSSESFRKAAKSVWLLHKLAFSFEPPASIFRVEKGADVDPKYMEMVLTLEDDPRFIPKVSFMVSPGLRLRKIVMKCEVYLSGAATTDSQLPRVPALGEQSS